MTCDGKVRECIYYLRRIHTRATYWHGSTVREAMQRYRNYEGDYTIDLGVRYEEDPGTCVCDAGCEKWITGADWGKSTVILRRKDELVRDSHVPHVIVHERRETVTEITSSVQCLDPSKEITYQLKEGEDVETAFAKMRERAMKDFELEFEAGKGEET